MVSVAELRTYINSDLNVLLRGKHGTGKTTMLMDACAKEGLKMELFNAANMDVYTDLVGVPKPHVNPDGTEELHMVRPRKIDEANVVFIDELNRAFDPKTTNALFELVQFRSINGQRLPNLKCVIAAMNPEDNEEYDVNPLDPALLDRFHLVIDVEADVKASYMMTKFDPEVATALVTWWRDHDPKKSGYVSPRRLEFLGEVYTKVGTLAALKAAVPPGGTYDVRKLFTLLEESKMTPAQKAAAAAQRSASQSRLTSKGKVGKSGNNVATNAQRISKLAKAPGALYTKHGEMLKIRRSMNPQEFADLYSHQPFLDDVDAVSMASEMLSSGIGNERLFDEYMVVFEAMPGTVFDRLMMAGVTPVKHAGMVREARNRKRRRKNVGPFERYL